MQPTPPPDTCALCGAPTAWVYLEHDRIRLAVDPEPSPHGYLEKVTHHVPGTGGIPVVRRRVGHRLTEAHEAGAELYAGHFARCPERVERRESFDHGGLLAPGTNVVRNATGRPERLERREAG